MQFLRQATASQVVQLGPFIDDTDFKTVKTGLTIANTDIKIVQGGASTSKNSGGGTHRQSGTYEATFDATDTATVGRAMISVAATAALIVVKEITILHADAYDLLFATTPTCLIRSGVIANGTAQAGTSTSLQLAAATNFTTDNVPVGGTLVITSGTGVGQARTVTSYVNSTDTATVSPAWTTTPDNTSVYELFAGPPATTTNLPGVDVVTINSQITTAAAGITFPSSIASPTNITAAAGVALTSAYDFAKGTVAVTEAYSADGAAPTPVQALMLILQYLYERSLSGTTLTIKKLDGSTSAATVTLDSGSAPTTHTRAT